MSKLLKRMSKKQFRGLIV